MRGSRFGSLLLVALVACCATLSASPILGQFSFAGNITATGTTITWTDTDAALTPNQATVGSPSTGVFSVLTSGDKITIANLDAATEPANNPDAPFTPAVTFITFNPATGLPTLDINEVFHGFEGAAQCSTNVAAAAAGQVCTVPGPPNSPFNFVNNPGVGGPQATATFAFAGVTGAGNIWQGNFTAQFAVPFQQVLRDLALGGSVSNTYSATISEFAGVGVPEPPASALMGLGLGLVGLATVLRRRRRA